jgi:hypothetical protein
MDIILTSYGIPITKYIKNHFSGGLYEKIGVFLSIVPPATKLLQQEAYHKTLAMVSVGLFLQIAK